MRVTFAAATPEDATAIAVLRTAVADHLSAQFGQGHWSAAVTERGVLYNLRHSRVILARSRNRIVGTFRLCTKKPWAIDRSYFTKCRRPIYLHDMAVEPGRQRAGVGRQLVEEAVRQARAWPGDALCLDAYDAEAGAGDFYRKCGFREMGRVVYRTVPLVYFEMMLAPPSGDGA